MSEKIQTTMPAALSAALVIAQATARAVGKDAKNSHHGYKYASAEGIIIEAREALTTADLALLTIAWRYLAATTIDAETGEERQARGGAIGRVVVDYLLVHKSGETFPIQTSTPVVPDRGRPPDKAEFAALTANLAYTLRGVLLMPRDDDQASIDARDDRGYDPAARREPTREEPSPRTEERRDPERSATPPADDERGTWETFAKELLRKIEAYTDRDALKDTMVEEIVTAHKRGMPRDLVQKLRDAYNAHADRLDAAEQKAAA